MHALFTRLFLFSLLVVPLYLPARFLWVKKTGAQVRFSREIVLCLFAAFVGGLLSLVLQPGNVWAGGPGFPSVLVRIRARQGINLVPFFTIRRFFAAGANTAFVVNVVANVLMFSPLGFCLPLLWRRWQHAGKVLLAGFAFSACIETTQLFIGRSVDIDDLMLNTLGVMVGYWLYLLARRLFPKTKLLAADASAKENG